MKLKKAFCALLLSCAVPALAATYNDDIYLPDLGVAGSLGLTVAKEEQLGGFFIRQARAAFPIVEDPVLNEYLASVGNKLISAADNVMFPFEFFIVNDTNLNAAAFLGGKVQVNTGLFIYSMSEDEFASVLAHEISHVTQRHLARFIEAQSLKNHVTIASVIGSIAMTIINPVVGMAAANAVVGANIQSTINFTRDNEYEADRLGLNLMYRAGFNPEGMVNMFRRLLAMQGNLNPVFTMLIDHPLSEIRVAEAVNRTAQLPKRQNSKNPDFYLAKARVDVRYSKLDHKFLKETLETHPPLNNTYYQNYALALVNYELGDYAKAREYLNKLGPEKDNIFAIDLLTDLDLKQGRNSEAVARLQSAYKRTPRSSAAAINLANAYIQSSRYKDASDLLRNFIRRTQGSTIAYNLLAEAYEKQGDRCNGLQSRGEYLVLKAQYAAAIGSYNQALGICRNNLTQEKIKARVVEISNQRADDEAITQGR